MGGGARRVEPRLAPPTVAEAARRRAEKRLPKSVYGALIAGSERGVTVQDSVTALQRAGGSPPARRRAVGKAGIGGHQVMGQEISFPVLISPTGVQAVHPQGEVAVARAAAARGTAMGLSSFASMPVEDVGACPPKTFFQIYWIGTQDQIAARVGGLRRRSGRPHRGARLVLLPRAGLGQPDDPRDREPAGRCCASPPRRWPSPRWFLSFARTGRRPRSGGPQHGGEGPEGADLLRRLRRRVDADAAAELGTTSPGSASSGAVPSCSRASAASTTPSGPSTPG